MQSRKNNKGASPAVPGKRETSRKEKVFPAEVKAALTDGEPVLHPAPFFPGSRTCLPCPKTATALSARRRNAPEAQSLQKNGRPRTAHGLTARRKHDS